MSYWIIARNSDLLRGIKDSIVLDIITYGDLLRLLFLGSESFYEHFRSNITGHQLGYTPSGLECPSRSLCISTPRFSTLVYENFTTPRKSPARACASYPCSSAASASSCIYVFLLLRPVWGFQFSRELFCSLRRGPPFKWGFSPGATWRDEFRMLDFGVPAWALMYLFSRGFAFPLWWWLGTLGALFRLGKEFQQDGADREGAPGVGVCFFPCNEDLYTVRERGGGQSPALLYSDPE